MMQDGADDFNIIIYAPLDRGTDRLSDWLTDCLTNWNIETAVSEWVSERRSGQWPNNYMTVRSSGLISPLYYKRGTAQKLEPTQNIIHNFERTKS